MSKKFGFCLVAVLIGIILGLIVRMIFDPQQSWFGLILVLIGLASFLWSILYEFDEPWKKYQVILPSLLIIAFGFYIVVFGI